MILNIRHGRVDLIDIGKALQKFIPTEIIVPSEARDAMHAPSIAFLIAREMTTIDISDGEEFKGMGYVTYTRAFGKIPKCLPDYIYALESIHIGD